MNLRSYMKRNSDLYILIFPAILFLLIFKLLPLMGNMIAFQDYQINLGKNMMDAIYKSDWVGLWQFSRIFEDKDSLNVVFNTFIIAFYKILFLFPIPVIMALMLNEMRNVLMKRFSQTIVFFPNFISWVVVSAMFIQILQTDGLINNLLHEVDSDKISYLTDYRFFRTILVVTEGWKSSGFATVIYLAAIASVNHEQYEAATVDGCGRFQKIFYITLPNISSTVVMIFIIQLGVQISHGSFEQVLTMYNPTVYKTGDIIQTYAYRRGLGSLEFSFSTAVGMLNGLVGVIVILSSNFFIRKLFGKSIW